MTDEQFWSRINVKKKYLIAVFIPIFLVFIYCNFLHPEDQKNRIEFAKTLLRSNFNGVVVRKYIVWFNHNEKVVEIRNKSGILKLSGFYWDNIYYLSNIGDTINKNADELVVKIKRGNSDSTVEMVEYYQKALKFK